MKTWRRHCFWKIYQEHPLYTQEEEKNLLSDYEIREVYDFSGVLCDEKARGSKLNSVLSFVKCILCEYCHLFYFCFFATLKWF